MLKKGDRVIYIPTHAAVSGLSHPDCEHGVVKRVGENGTVFVIYDNAVMRMVTGDESYTAAGTRPDDLVREEGP